MHNRGLGTCDAALYTPSVVGGGIPPCSTNDGAVVSVCSCAHAIRAACTVMTTELSDLDMFLRNGQLCFGLTVVPSIAVEPLGSSMASFADTSALDGVPSVYHDHDVYVLCSQASAALVRSSRRLEMLNTLQRPRRDTPSLDAGAASRRSVITFAPTHASCADCGRRIRQRNRCFTYDAQCLCFACHSWL